MHEMSLAESVIRIIEEHAKTHGFKHVKTVWLEIGSLSGVETEAMRFCFDAVAGDSVASGARLEIIAAGGEGWCMKCSQKVPVAALYDPCPRCGGYQVQVTGGTEMRVKELEVE